MKMTTPKTPKTFSCGVCDRTFARAEHVRRHEVIHQSAKESFSCGLCNKRFVRRDALVRHESTHYSAPNLLLQGGRACIPCATAKTRCSSTRPCTRCAKRSIACLDQPVIGMAGANETFEGGMIPYEPPIATIDIPTFEAVPAATYTNSDSMENWMRDTAANTNWLDHTHGMEPWNFALSPLPFAGFPFDITNDALPIVSEVIPSPVRTSELHSIVATSETRPVENAYTPSSTATVPGAAASSTESQTTVGDYYVDGESARRSRVRKRKLSMLHAEQASIPRRISVFSLGQADVTLSKLTSRVEIPTATYDKMRSMYEKVCLSECPIWTQFEAKDFPNLAVFQTCFDLYFEHFDQAMPIFHHTLLAQVVQNGPLVLSVAAIGNHYTEGNRSREFQISLHEFARRWTLLERESNPASEPKDWMDCAATLLHIVGVIYCGDERLQAQGLRQSSRLHSIYSAAQMSPRTSPPSRANGGDLVDKWHDWVQDEQRARLTHAIWLMDALLCYQFQQRPGLGLSDCLHRLPCPENIWDAKTAEQWSALHQSTERSQTLGEALHSLYVRNSLPRSTGEFARVIIIHGLFSRQGQVETYYSNSLSLWTPSADRQTDSRIDPNLVPWLPSVPEFAKWQNSACDCIDVLHWQANADIGRASGLEPPSVLHLHIARVVLLAPYRDIVELARLMTDALDDDRRRSIKARQQKIRLWATKHQYKARLSAIHAGVLFWHVRRYSIDAFYEAPAVALAALTLWAFGSFSEGHSTAVEEATSSSRASPPDARHSDEAEQDIILLDRPTDDELVQQFIRHGQTMQARLTGVGNLYGVAGPRRVLAQGCKLLASLHCWGIASSWRSLLIAVMTKDLKHFLDQPLPGNPLGQQTTAQESREHL